jgi:hypothetical protein
MRRTRNWQWNESPDKSGSYSWNQAIVSVLTDIREELQKLNSVLQCPNFIAVPSKLDQIAKNTRKRRRPKIVGKPKLRVVR